MALQRADSAGYMTNLAARLFARAIDEALRETGVGVGALPVFFALARGGAMTQGALARFAAIEQPTMAATLARLERDGLIARKPDPDDGRRATVALTPAGRRLWPRIEAAALSVNARALSDLSPDERRTLLALLARVAAALGHRVEAD